VCLKEALSTETAGTLRCSRKTSLALMAVRCARKRHIAFVIYSADRDRASFDSSSLPNVC